MREMGEIRGKWMRVRGGEGWQGMMREGRRGEAMGRAGREEGGERGRGGGVWGGGGGGGGGWGGGECVHTG